MVVFHITATVLCADNKHNEAKMLTGNRTLIKRDFRFGKQGVGELNELFWSVVHRNQLITSFVRSLRLRASELCNMYSCCDLKLSAALQSGAVRRTLDNYAWHANSACVLNVELVIGAALDPVPVALELIDTATLLGLLESMLKADNSLAQDQFIVQYNRMVQYVCDLMVCADKAELVANFAFTTDRMVIELSHPRHKDFGVRFTIASMR